MDVSSDVEGIEPPAITIAQGMNDPDLDMGFTDEEHIGGLRFQPESPRSVVAEGAKQETTHQCTAPPSEATT